MMAPHILQVDGLVGGPQSLGREEMLAAAEQLIDISTLDSARQGTAIRLRDLTQFVELEEQAKTITIHCSADDYQVSVPLELVIDRGLLIFERDGQPLPSELGGPMRFLVPDAAACRTAAIDACGNVKGVDHLRFS